MKNYTSIVCQVLFSVLSVLLVLPATAQVDLTEIIHRINAEGYPQTTYKKSGNLDWTIGNDDGDFNIQQGLNVDAGFLVKVKPSGDVGIGVDPQAKLHIDGSGSKLLVGGSGGVLSKFTVNAESGTEIARFRSDGNTKVYIGSDGKVGIGTATPADELTVDGNILVEGSFPFIKLDGGVGDNTGVQFNENGVKRGIIFYKDNIDALQFAASDAGSSPPQLVLKFGNDRIGIGTTSPDYKLHVEGKSNETEGLIRADVNYSGNSNITGVYSNSRPAGGYGYGGLFRGGRMGIDARAYGGDSGQTVYGVYANASGNGRNYAVYAVGNIKCTNRLLVNTFASIEDDGFNFELLVNGEGLLEEVKVKNSANWPDYVFEEDYQLLSLEDMQTYIRKNGHLPGLPSAETIQADGGFFLGDMQKRQLEKIEELSLYTIQLHEENKELRRENKEMKVELNELKSQLNALLERTEKLEKQD